MLDLDAVVMIMAIARDGSLAHASRTLGLPRTTLTRRVALLEEALGVRLVERSQRHLRLTEAGRLLVEQGAPLVDAARQVENTLQASTHFRLRTAVPPGVGMDLLEPLLKPDDEALAGLGLEIIYTDRDMHPIRDDFDLVVGLVPPTDGTLYCRSFLRFSWACFAAPAYLAARGTPTRAADLAAHSCIALRIPGGVSPFFWPVRAGMGLRVSPWFVSNSMHAALQMVIAGRGIGLLPDIPFATTSELVPVLQDEIGAEGEFFLSMGQRLNDSKRGRRIRILIEKALRHLRQTGGARTR
ncbi:MAG TPA: LysR family transcriptional regulator [Polyangium sp.]|nr:LysR family transcriptional regulator [Polyangium sp.]